jgi:nucleotide-binding universal stress UspA family protein
VEASADAELLVVGARGRGGFAGLLLGSVSQHCIHHARGPVAVIRQDHAGPLRAVERIVVGLDGSNASQVALRWACSAAQAHGATLEVVHAWHPPYSTAYTLAIPPVDAEAIEHAGQELLDRSLDGVDLRGARPPVEKVLVMGSAAQALLDAAKGADLVVVGTRGVGGFTGLLLGSVSHQIAHHAPCPVVIVPPSEVSHGSEPSRRG